MKATTRTKTGISIVALAVLTSSIAQYPLARMNELHQKTGPCLDFSARRRPAYSRLWHTAEPV